MEKSAKYFATGLFVTITIFLFVGFLVSLAGPQDEDELDYYTIAFTDPISGLEEGSKVQYMGVNVGKVVKTHLAADNFSLVLVDIAVARGTPVRARTKVVLQTQGITGLVRLEMSTQNDDKLMPARRPGMEYPVLAGQGSNLYKALEKIPAIMEQVSDISRQINSVITRNRPALERFSSEGLSQITASSESVKKAASSVRRLSDKLEENPSQILYKPSSRGVDIPP
jgi:phospholipid/cholesterol/gamma-HCH transport system substrate-binding protein